MGIAVEGEGAPRRGDRVSQTRPIGRVLCKQAA
jgi:hypothetical protein